MYVCTDYILYAIEVDVIQSANTKESNFSRQQNLSLLRRLHFQHSN